LKSHGWSIGSFIRHDPFEANTVSDVAEWDSAKHVTILENSNLESCCFAKMRVKIAFWALASSTPECTWEESKATKS
jgi:hypothetical protein